MKLQKFAEILIILIFSTILVIQIFTYFYPQKLDKFSLLENNKTSSIGLLLE